MDDWCPWYILIYIYILVSSISLVLCSLHQSLYIAWSVSLAHRQAGSLSISVSICIYISVGISVLIFISRYLSIHLSRYLSLSSSLSFSISSWINVNRSISWSLARSRPMDRSLCLPPFPLIKFPLYPHSPSFHMHTQNLHIKISSLSCTWHDRPITQVIHPQILPPDWPTGCCSWCHGNLWWSSVAVHIKDISRKEGQKQGSRIDIHTFKGNFLDIIGLGGNLWLPFSF